MYEVEHPLKLAVQRGEVVEIVYNAGSQPGALRPLIPIQVDSETLLAREPGVPHQKAFKLEKIAFVRMEDGTTVSNSNVTPIEPEQWRIAALPTLADYAEVLRPKFETQGWHVYHDAQVFGVAALLKSGKPRKRPTISVSFEDRSLSYSLDFTTGEVVEQRKTLTGRERPWRVESYLQPMAKAYGELHAAMEFFVGEVHKADPKAGADSPRTLNKL